jgi:hypothetical protein
MNDEEIIIDFKSNSEFYEKEKDGRKPNTERFFDGADNTKREQRLERGEPNTIRITNTKTGESFKRKITDISQWEDIWIISWDATTEARASEQDKAKAIQILAFEQGIAVGYNRGQAELIERLRTEKVIEATAKKWYEESELTDADEWKDADATTKEDYFDLTNTLINFVIKKASESAEAKGDEATREAIAGTDNLPQGNASKEQAGTPANSAPENAKEEEFNVWLERLVNFYQNKKAIETKPENACKNCGRTLAEHGAMKGSPYTDTKYCKGSSNLYEPENAKKKVK